jgi:hypothetical protein
MSDPRKLALLAAPLALGLAGCISYCECDPLLKAAAKGDPAAINEMGELGRPRVPSSGKPLAHIEQAFDAIAPNLSATAPYVRTLSVDSLRHLTERAPDIFRNRYPTIFDGPLEDPEPSVRYRAAWALGRIGETRPALRRAAHDPDSGVASMACWALGRARDEGAYLDLAAALDREGEVRVAAIAALSRMTSQRFGDDAAAWKRFCIEEAKRQELIAKMRAVAEEAAIRSDVPAPASAPIGSPTRIRDR